MRILYRLEQFRNALKSAPSGEEIESIREQLPPDLLALFMRMHPSEQAHSLRIYHQLQRDGETNRDLLIAALLHDVGKSRYPLLVWERILIVLAEQVIPEKVTQWGEGDSSGWRRPFVVAKKHPEWGAEMVEQAGASKLCVEIIRHHQDHLPVNLQSKHGLAEQELLLRLQILDNHN